MTDNIYDYRQVSVLSNLRKVFEKKVLKNCFQNFCQTFSFSAINKLKIRKKKRNTRLTALICLYNLQPAFEVRKYAIYVSVFTMLVLILCPARIYLTNWKDVANVG